MLGSPFFVSSADSLPFTYPRKITIIANLFIEKKILNLLKEIIHKPIKLYNYEEDFGYFGSVLRDGVLPVVA